MDDLSKMHKRTRESALEFSNDFVQNNGNESQILPERKEGDPDTSQGHERRSILLGSEWKMFDENRSSNLTML